MRQQCYRLGPALYIQLSIDSVEVRLDGSLTDAVPVCNFLVRGPLQYHREDFHLPVGQRRESRDLHLKRFRKKHGL